MSPPDAPLQGPLPRGLRVALVVCLVLSSCSGFSALNECVGLAQLEDPRLTQGAPTGMDPALFTRVAQGYVSALKPQRDSRMFLLGTLSVACSLAFVSAGRMLRPEGLSRERMRQLLAGTLLTAAVLRTLSGAQETALFRQLVPLYLDVLKALPGEAPPPEALLATMARAPMFAMVGLTVLMAGAFALFGRYFQSERVRQAIDASDARLVAQKRMEE